MVSVQCLGSTHLGDFHMEGAQLRKQGWNRVGNMLVPNSNYCAFEDWVMPILDQLLQEQQQQGICWTPSKVHRCTYTRTHRCARMHSIPRDGSHDMTAYLIPGLHACDPQDKIWAFDLSLSCTGGWGSS